MAFPKVKEFCEPLCLSVESLKQIEELLDQEIRAGLGKASNPTASVKCFPTYVTDLPNRKEEGKFLALDLGGTNFRVLLIELGGENKTLSKIFAVPQSVMLGPGTGLFDHIAECLATFMKEHDVHAERLPLGFTFSFPCKQEGLTRARLVKWTKGFKCSGVEGEDVVRLLQEAIARHGEVGIDILAALNDTTGTLMSCAYKDPKCLVGLIIGTGSNACYMESIDNVELYEPDGKNPEKMIINTEWGAFGDNGKLEFVRTKYDKDIDVKSLNPGRQTFEKMISGMYMGELARLVLVDLIQEKALLCGQNTTALNEKGRFYTKYISEIESDRKGEYQNCRQVLGELGMPNVSDEDCFNVRFVCEVVSKRAAQLAATGAACLLNKMKEESVVVAVDGSVYRFHPHFHNLMTETIKKLVDPKIKFDLMLSEDGSGRGAALVAAVASRKKLSNN